MLMAGCFDEGMGDTMYRSQKSSLAYCECEQPNVGGGGPGLLRFRGYLCPIYLTAIEAGRSCLGLWCITGPRYPISPGQFGGKVDQMFSRTPGQLTGRITGPRCTRKRRQPAWGITGPRFTRTPRQLACWITGPMFFSTSWLFVLTQMFILCSSLVILLLFSSWDRKSVV